MELGKEIILCATISKEFLRIPHISQVYLGFVTSWSWSFKEVIYLTLWYCFIYQESVLSPCR